jgi:hypothetical protein
LSRWFPTLVACSRSFCRSRTSITAMATAQDTGFPPYCNATQSNRLWLNDTDYHIKIHNTSRSTRSSFRIWLFSQCTVAKTVKEEFHCTQLNKRDWEWGFTPHPKSLLQYIPIILTAIAPIHTARSTK